MSITNFSQSLFISFFKKLCTAIEIWKQKKVTEVDCPGKFLFALKWVQGHKMGLEFSFFIFQDYHCWLDVARRAQSPPGVPRRTRGEFGWSEGSMTTIEVTQNKRLI